MYSYELSKRLLLFEKTKKDTIHGVNIVIAQNHSVFESGTNNISTMISNCCVVLFIYKYHKSQPQPQLEQRKQRCCSSSPNLNHFGFG